MIKTSTLVLGFAMAMATISTHATDAAAPKKSAAKPAAAKVDLANGKKVFETFCVACHGVAGKGDGVAAAALNPKPRNFTDGAYMKTRTRETLAKVIAEGGQSVGLSPLMSGWKTSLNEKQRNDVLDYVLTFGKAK